MCIFRGMYFYCIHGIVSVTAVHVRKTYNITDTWQSSQSNADNIMHSASNMLHRTAFISNTKFRPLNYCFRQYRNFRYEKLVISIKIWNECSQRYVMQLHSFLVGYITTPNETFSCFAFQKTQALPNFSIVIFTNCLTISRRRHVRTSTP